MAANGPPQDGRQRGLGCGLGIPLCGVGPAATQGFQRTLWVVLGSDRASVQAWKFGSRSNRLFQRIPWRTENEVLRGMGVNNRSDP